MPYFPEKGRKAFFRNTSQEEKTVSNYTGIDFLRLGELSIFDFWRYLHDAVIWNCSQTEKGEEYLRNAYNYAQKKADRAALAELERSEING